MFQLPLFNVQPSAWTVAALTRYLRQLLEGDEALQDAWVRGEISNFTRSAAGHLYFTLKDEKAALRCVMWKGSASRLNVLPRDGDAVEVHGAISVYETAGQYQLVADTIRPTGEGLLFQEFLRLKARLEAEGLFDPARKRPIPRWPQRIGIVTSPTGAALRDMLHTLRRRYPLVSVILAPTLVQGDEAPPGIVAALAALNEFARPDVILLARGGGSIEDLWAFNDERVARAIAASAAPVISGVGHETDFTIADFAADLRAPTPTAAAELSVPNREDLLQTLDELTARLERGIQAGFSSQRWELSALQNRLRLHSPQAQLLANRQQVSALSRRMILGAQHSFDLRRARLTGLEQRLAALNPLAVLARGFAVVAHPDGRIVRSVGQTAPGDRLNVRVSDGAFDVKRE